MIRNQQHVIPVQFVAALLQLCSSLVHFSVMEYRIEHTAWEPDRYDYGENRIWEEEYEPSDLIDPVISNG